MKFEEELIVENATMNSTPGVNVTDQHYTPYDMRPETYIVPAVFAIIFIVGVAGNGTLIAVFLRHRTMRNVPNTYIVSLAVADLLVILTVVPLVSVVYIFDSWPWGQTLCSISEFVKDVSIGVSIFSLTTLAANRYCAIVNPLRKFHGGQSASIATALTTLFIWLLAILCGLPGLIGSEVKEFNVTATVKFAVCYPYPSDWGEVYAKSMVVFKFLAYYAVPLYVICVFYVLIALHLIHSARDMPGEKQGAQRQVQARKKVAITVLTFVIIFGLCFLPIHVFMLWFYFYPNAKEEYNTFWHVFRIIGFCLSFLNSCSNPVALYFVSAAFRKHFRRYLFCKHSSSDRNSQVDFRRNSMTCTTMSRRYTSKKIKQNEIETTMVTFAPNLNNTTDIVRESCLMNRDFSATTTIAAPTTITTSMIN